MSTTDHRSEDQLPEDARVRRGSRSRLPIIVAVHSTVLGPAVGGCRVLAYPTWRDGLGDALRLSSAMTRKCAVAGLPHGGGKAVVALPPGDTLSTAQRRAVLLDVGEVVNAFDGRFHVATDVGTTPDDLLVVAEHTAHVLCLPPGRGGSGEPAEPTAQGVLAALRATCAAVFGDAGMARRSIAVHGVGQVGSRLVRRLAAAGARLVVTDTDGALRGLADEVAARWTTPDALLDEPVDVLVPASLGGLLTRDVARRLRCHAVVGPANNQLATDDVADLLADRDITWVPDFVASAGGAIYGVLRDLHAATHETAMARVGGIEDAVGEILAAAQERRRTPLQISLDIVADRLGGARCGPSLLFPTVPEQQ